jgi:CheY-like chemotaxis protein
METITHPTVLFVDDDNLIRELSTEIMTELKYNCLAAASGREAIAIYKEKWQSINFVILDMMMPEMTGDMVLEELIKINPDVKAIFCTGYAPDELKTKVRTHSCEILDKPTDFDVLNDKLRMML